jgi:urea transport system ATP-binding protein
VTEPVLHVDDVGVTFDGFRALDHVTLRVAKGELRFLIGPNGAGKTTLVDVITGLTPATTGRVLFAGQDITSLREQRRVRLGIGRSFQTPVVFASLSVIDNLDLAASFRRRLPALFHRRRSVSDVISSTLERVVQGPQLLLLDEPVAGLSTEERLATGALLEELAGDHTVLVIEHDMAFLRRFARSVTVLHEGRILSEGSVAEVQADPAVHEVYLGRSKDERSGARVAVNATTGHAVPA